MKGTTRTFLIVLAMATILATVTTSAAVAEKGGRGHNYSGGGSLSLVMVNDANGNGLPNYGDSVTFNVSTTATNVPFVGLRCWQGTNWVYDAYVGYFPSYLGDPWFALVSNYWDPGLAATCTARLFYNDSRGREHVLATVDFGVAPK